MGSLFHFLYGLSGECFVLGLIAPINESVFEHTKLFPVPAALWYGLVYRFRRGRLRANPWFTAALLSIVTQGLGMLFLYYFYTGALALESLALDIGTFLLTVVLGQAVGLHGYRHGCGLDYRVALWLILVLLIASALLTVAPPQRPMFLDPITNTYGMAGLGGLW